MIDFTEQAPQLAQQIAEIHPPVNGSWVADKCPEWIVSISGLVASALADAATQGQAVGIERAAIEACTVCQDSTYWKPATRLSHGFWSHEHKTYGYTTHCGAPYIRALSPDPLYLDRVRNEAVTAERKRILNLIPCTCPSGVRPTVTVHHKDCLITAIGNDDAD